MKKLQGLGIIPPKNTDIKIDSFLDFTGIKLVALKERMNIALMSNEEPRAIVLPQIHIFGLPVKFSDNRGLDVAMFEVESHD